MDQSTGTPEARFAAIVDAMQSSANVTAPADGVEPTKRFGASALKVNGKIFAMLVNGELVVKLPRSRVDALIAAGAGRRFATGQGRPMKEWLSLAPDSDEEWLPLARDAMAFVAAQG